LLKMGLSRFRICRGLAFNGNTKGVPKCTSAYVASPACSHVENGIKKVLREALNIVATVRVFPQRIG
jgi:hypothetical protein